MTKWVYHYYYELLPIGQLRYRSVKILKKNQKSKDVYLRETWITNRVMLVFAAVVLGLWGFSSLVDGLNYAASYETGLTVARITLALFALATLGSLALVWKNRDAEQEPFRVVTPDLIAGICAVGALGAWLVLRNFSTAMQLLYVLLPALAVLYLVYYIFQREFFLYTLAGALSAFAMWNCGNAVGGAKRLLLALAVIALNGALCWANMKSEDGTFRGFRLRECTGCTKLPMIVYPALALLVAVALVLGAPVAFYLVYGTGAAIFAAAVYFTVKLL